MAYMTFCNVSQHSVASHALSEGINTFRSMCECPDNFLGNQVLHQSQLPFSLSGSKASLLLNKGRFAVFGNRCSPPLTMAGLMQIRGFTITHPKRLLPSFIWGHANLASAKHPAAFPNKQQFELLTLNIPVFHKREETFEFVLQLSFM